MDDLGPIGGRIGSVEVRKPKTGRSMDKSITRLRDDAIGDTPIDDTII